MVFIDNGKFKRESKGTTSKAREIHFDSKKKWTEISHKWEVKLQTYFKETELNGNTERRSFSLFFTHAVPAKV